MFVLYIVIATALCATLATVNFILKVGHRKPTVVDSAEKMSRPLGIQEVALVNLHAMGDLISAAALMLSSRSSLVDHAGRCAASEALRSLARKHPMLRARLDCTHPKKLRFVEIEPENQHFDIQLSDSKQWTDAFEEQLTIPFDEIAGPLWRFVMVSIREDDQPINPTLPHRVAFIFAFHHAIADGLSCVQFFKDFVNTLLESIVSGEQKTFQYSAKDADESNLHGFPPPLEVLLPKPSLLNLILIKLQIWFLLLPKLGQLFLQLYIWANGIDKNLWVAKFGTKMERDPKVEKATKIIPLEFSQEDTSRIVHAAKDHGVTLTAFAEAASLCAIADIYHGSNSSAPAEELRIPVEIAINLRRFNTAFDLNHTIGCYFGVAQDEIAVKGEDRQDLAAFWRLATKCGHSIHDQMLKKCLETHDEFTMLARLPLTVMEAALDSNAGRTQNVLSISSLGRHEIIQKGLETVDGREQQEYLQAQSLHIASAEHNHGGIFDLYLLTIDGKLSWTVVYYANIAAREIAEKFSKRLQGILLDNSQL